MTVYRQVITFSDTNGDSFSETHHINASNAADAAFPGFGVMTARAALLHPLFTLQKCRASNVEGNRDTAVKQYGFQGTYVTSGVTSEEALDASAAAIYTITGKTGGSRRWWCRGVSDLAVGRSPTNGADYVTAKFDAQVKDFFGKAGAVSMGIRKLASTARTPLNFVPIQSYAADVSGTRTVLTMPAVQPWLKGDRVIVYGVNQKDFNALNGYFMILEVDGASYTINYKLPPIAAGTKMTGTVRKAIFSDISLYSAENVGFSNFGNHQTKSPLFGSRGARRVRRLRTQA